MTKKTDKSQSLPPKLHWEHKDFVGLHLDNSQVYLQKDKDAIKINKHLLPRKLTDWTRLSGTHIKNVLPFKPKENYLIKGNNLVALHSLIQPFEKKIKLIYIDPPYNTGGNKFNYQDNQSHSVWLTFMKNRLEVARKLLRHDGIIYISCDDRENAYLKVLCDEIFGRDKFITNLIWRKKAGGANDSNDIAVEHEYILAYRKEENGIYKLPLEERISNTYSHKDDKYETHGGFKTKDLNDPSLNDSYGLHYDITCPDGTVLKAMDHQWKCTQETFEQRLQEDRIVFKKVKGMWHVHYKIYLNEERGRLNHDEDGNIAPRGQNLTSILYKTALNKDGNDDIKRLFDGEKPFTYPKPVKLLETLIRSATKDGDIILDFFAGSGTTAEAVIKINKEDNGKRKFILIEQMDYIENITKTRIQRALKYHKSREDFLYLALADTPYKPISKPIKDLDQELTTAFYNQ